ncbi:hypothetical protein [Candidatus Enterovibrio escicola]
MSKFSTLICHNRMDILFVWHYGISKSIVAAVTSIADFDAIFLKKLRSK